MEAFLFEDEGKDQLEDEDDEEEEEKKNEAEDGRKDTTSIYEEIYLREQLEL